MSKAGKMSEIKGTTNLNTLTSTKAQAWCGATELQSKSLIVEVDDVLFHLHKKSPLLWKSGRLNKLVFEAQDTENDHIKLLEFPGGAESFELAAKFCSGTIPLHITSSKVAALRCAAEYLEMTQDSEQGNLISRTEEFLSYVMSVSWLDTFAVLRSCAHLSPWAEKLNIVQRCVDSIAWKASTDPARITWAFTVRASAGVSAHMPATANYVREIENEDGGNSQTESESRDPEEIHKLRVELGDLQSFCQSVQEQLGKFSRGRTRIAVPTSSMWKFSLKSSSSKQTNTLSNVNGMPLPNPHPKKGRTWIPVKWRRNSK